MPYNSLSSNSKSEGDSSRTEAAEKTYNSLLSVSGGIAAVAFYKHADAEHLQFSFECFSSKRSKPFLGYFGGRRILTILF